MTECAFGVFQPIRTLSNLLFIEAEVVYAFGHMLLGGENLRTGDSDQRDGICAVFSPTGLMFCCGLTFILLQRDSALLTIPYLYARSTSNDPSTTDELRASPGSSASKHELVVLSLHHLREETRRRRRARRPTEVSSSVRIHCPRVRMRCPLGRCVGWLHIQIPSPTQSRSCTYSGTSKEISCPR